MVKRKLMVAVVGCGNAGYVHASAISNNINVELKYFVDIDKEKANLFVDKFGGIALKDYRQLFNRGVEFVCICTPHNLHASMAIDFLKSGKHVLIEKPLAISIKDAQSIIKTSRKHQRFAGVVLQHRFDRSFLLLKRLINDIGKIQFINAFLICNRSSEYYSGWRSKKNSGESLLTNQFIHVMDLIYLIGGEVEKWKGFKEKFSKKLIFDDNFCISMKFKNNSLGNISISNNIAHDFLYEIKIYGEKGYFILTDKSLTYFNNGKTYYYDEKFSLFRRFFRRKLSKKSYYGEGHFVIIDDFIKSILSGSSPKVTAENSLFSLKMTLDCNHILSINKKFN